MKLFISLIETMVQQTDAEAKLFRGDLSTTTLKINSPGLAQGVLDPSSTSCCFIVEIFDLLGGAQGLGPPEDASLIVPFPRFDRCRTPRNLQFSQAFLLLL